MNENDHLSSRLFERLLQQDLSPERAAGAYLHLFRCATCRLLVFNSHGAKASTHLAEVFGLQPVMEWRRELEHGSPGRVEPSARSVYALYRELEECPPSQWVLALANNEEYHHPVALAAILEAAKERWGKHPEEAEILVTAARRTLDVMRRRAHGAGWAAWRGRVEAFQGNMHRIFGRFRQAHEALAEAEAWLEAAGSGPGQHAELAWLRGVLAREERRFAEAAELLEAARAEPRLVGGYTLAQEIGLVLGNVYGDAGLPERAIEVKEALYRSHSPTELGDENHLLLSQSLVTNYAEAGRFQEASRLLRVVKELARDRDLGVNAYRITWAEAIVWQAQGMRSMAASLYREVYQRFQAAGMPYDAALAALSLAEMHLAEGDTAAAAELAEELVTIFSAQGIHREATMAGLVLVEALRREAATAAQVQKVKEAFQGAPRARRPSG